MNPMAAALPSQSAAACAEGATAPASGPLCAPDPATLTPCGVAGCSGGGLPEAPTAPYRLQGEVSELPGVATPRPGAWRPVVFGSDTFPGRRRISPGTWPTLWDDASVNRQARVDEQSPRPSNLSGVAQLVEPSAHNASDAGSSPAAVTIFQGIGCPAKARLPQPCNASSLNSRVASVPLNPNTAGNWLRWFASAGCRGAFVR